MHQPDVYLSNQILAGLPKEVLETIKLDLKLVQMKRGGVLNHLGTKVRHIYFITRGLASLVKTMSDGRMVEIGAIGPEGLIGVNALFDVETALFETIVQLEGEAFLIPVLKLRAIMKTNPHVHDLLEGYVHTVLGQIAQTAACNRLHTTEERCCRWLLVCHDAAKADSFQLTHEFLAIMLGVARVRVTHIAGILQKAAIIRYHRGTIKILDRADLEKRSCECYTAVKSLSTELFQNYSCD